MQQQLSATTRASTISKQAFTLTKQAVTTTKQASATAQASTNMRATASTTPTETMKAPDSSPTSPSNEWTETTSDTLVFDMAHVDVDEVEQVLPTEHDEEMGQVVSAVVVAVAADDNPYKQIEAADLQLRLMDFRSARQQRRERLSCWLTRKVPRLHTIYLTFQACRTFSWFARWCLCMLISSGRQMPSSAGTTAAPQCRGWTFKVCPRSVTANLSSRSLSFLVCTVVLLATYAVNGDGSWEFFDTSNAIFEAWAQRTDRIVLYGEWYRIVTSIFLHDGRVHLLGNMVGLWAYGPSLERLHGSCKVAVLFTVATFGANMASGVFLPDSWGVGASGGNLALIGILVPDILSNFSHLFVVEMDESPKLKKELVRALLCELTTLVVFCLVPGAGDPFAHLGGLFFGYCFAAPFAVDLNRSRTIGLRGGSALWWRVVCFVAGSICFITLIVILWRNDGVEPLPCPKCHELFLCLPFFDCGR